MLNGAVGRRFAGSRNRNRRAIGVEQAEELGVRRNPCLRPHQANDVPAFDFPDIGQRTVPSCASSSGLSSKASLLLLAFMILLLNLNTTYNTAWFWSP